MSKARTFMGNYVAAVNRGLRFANGAKAKKCAEAMGIPKSHAVSFDLPAGFTCPQALECRSTAVFLTGKIKDGTHTKFRCFQASLEAGFPTVRAFRHAQWHWVRFYLEQGGPTLLADALDMALEDKIELVRINASGDMFSMAYLQAWIILANRRPDVRFYGYTKSIGLVKNINLPDNMFLTASLGGKQDAMIGNMRTSHVVSSAIVAKRRSLPVDNDDTHAAYPKGSFALVVHGTQPAGGHRLEE